MINQVNLFVILTLKVIKLPKLDQTTSAKQIKYSILYFKLISVKMKVLYGSKSWMTHLTKEDFTDQNCEAYVDVEYIQEAGHHIYADQYKQFNYVLNKFLKSED